MPEQSHLVFVLIDVETSNRLARRVEIFERIRVNSLARPSRRFHSAASSASSSPVKAFFAAIAAAVSSTPRSLRIPSLNLSVLKITNKKPVQLLLNRFHFGSFFRGTRKSLGCGLPRL